MNSKDVLLWTVWGSLARDLGKELFDPAAEQSPLKRLNKVIEERDTCGARRLYWPNYHVLDAQQAKVYYQLESFLKRWTLSDDVYTETELQERTLEEFIETQSKVLRSLDETPVLTRVLDGAKKLCSEILGGYDVEEHKRRCRFGSKAAFGLKRKDAYLHNRIPKLSATKQQVKVFGKWLEDDPQLLKILGSNKSRKIRTTNYLVLTVVPKSWKAGRTIVPDTVLGGFVANGLGDMISERLRVNAGLDISRKTAEHRRMACYASKTGHLTTADMSKASDRISWPLLRRILPNDWLDVIDADRVHKVVFSHRNPVTRAEIRTTDVKVHSPLLMGKGYTFPLQTLVFYSLLQSIAALTGEGESYISVYGDDLIYPSRMHHYVSSIFPRLGLLLNEGKTFSTKADRGLSSHKGCFRESCGGDYLRGVDIRPYMPQGASGDNLLPEESVGQAEYCGLVYTILNGLLSRWEWWEIRTTVRLLLIEAQSCFDEILVVPNRDSVSSGLRMDKDALNWVKWIDENLVIHHPVVRRVTKRNKGYIDLASYKCLKTTPPKEEISEDDESIYLWNSLRLSITREECQDHPGLQYKFRSVPGLREEWRSLKQLQQWETPNEVAVTVRQKMYVTPDHNLHEKRPQGPSQVVWRTHKAVTSRSDLGHALLVEGSCPPHCLYDALLDAK